MSKDNLRSYILAQKILKASFIAESIDPDGMVVLSTIACKIADKLLSWNHDLNFNASFRSYRHELKQGRSGKSNHVWLKTKWKRGTGYAVDISHMNMPKQRTRKFIEFLIERGVARICRYSTFLHVEFTSIPSKTKLYRQTEGGWRRVKTISEMW